MKRKIFFSGSRIDLANLLKDDLLSLKKWRNGQMSILRQTKLLTDNDQKKWFQKIKKDKNQILFAILNKSGELIGYCGLVYIDWINSRAEVSFLLETGAEKKKKYYQELFLDTLGGLRQYAFKTIKLHKLFTETFEFRKLHILTLEKFGFKRDGKLTEHVFYNNKYINSIIHYLLNINS